VFQLVPLAFEARVKEFYANMGEPAIMQDSFWPTYQQLQQDFMDLSAADQEIQDVVANYDPLYCAIDEEMPPEILPGLKELRSSADAVGPAAGRIDGDEFVFMEPEAADFTDCESDGS
jgi:hypothetical protein